MGKEREVTAHRLERLDARNRRDRVNGIGVAGRQGDGYTSEDVRAELLADGVCDVALSQPLVEVFVYAQFTKSALEACNRCLELDDVCIRDSVGSCALAEGGFHRGEGGAVSSSESYEVLSERGKGRGEEDGGGPHCCWLRQLGGKRASVGSWGRKRGARRLGYIYGVGGGEGQRAVVTRERMAPFLI